jgi:hypothetical protein
MTISSTTNRNDYPGTGAQTGFTYSFKVIEDTDLQVILTQNDGTEVVQTLVESSPGSGEYTVSGVGSASGGTVTMGVAPAADEEISIRRVRPLTQETDIRNQGRFYPEAHEDAFDHLVMIAQQHQDEIDRSLKLPPSIDPADFDMNLPTTIVDAADKVPVINATSDGWADTASWPTTTEIVNAEANATDAAASATLAEEWASKVDGIVDATDYSSKAYAIGGTGVTSTSGKGAAKEWATTTGAAVDTSEFSAKEYAQGITATGGSAKDWAQKTSAAVTGSSYSAKEHAQGTQTLGQAGGGSSKSWATYTGGTVDDTEYSSKYYAEQAATTASVALGNDVLFKVFGDSPVTLTSSEKGKVISCDCTSGAIAITLPQISALTLTTPFPLIIKKTDSTANAVTITRAGTDTIDGSTSISLTLQYEGVFLFAEDSTSPDVWSMVKFGAASSGGGGGGSIKWNDTGPDAPVFLVENSQETYLFEDALSQYLYTVVKVPSTYVAGFPISMKVSHYSPSTSGTMLVQTLATLIRTGTDALTSTTNQRTSTNSALTNTVANQLRTATCDLTSTTGTINSVAVSPNDLILVRLTRDTGTDTDTGTIRVLPGGCELTFR